MLHRSRSSFEPCPRKQPEHEKANSVPFLPWLEGWRTRESRCGPRRLLARRWRHRRRAMDYHRALSSGSRGGGHPDALLLVGDRDADHGQHDADPGHGPANGRTRISVSAMCVALGQKTRASQRGPNARIGERLAGPNAMRAAGGRAKQRARQKRGQTLVQRRSPVLFARPPSDAVDARLVGR
jgi:hypothetical protein